MNTETPSPPTSPKDSTRPGAANFRRGLRWFLAEFIVVVAGILVAMSLNAWYQDRIDARNGLQYLALLSRDLQAMAQELDDRVRFEELQTQDAALLYRALSAPRLPADTLPLSMAVVHLSQRRTILLKSATYDDLVSTGNFHLIRNATLRDRIAEFYQLTRLQFEINNKNNTFFVDENFAARLVLSGLVLPRPSSNLPLMRSTDAQVNKILAGGHRTAARRAVATATGCSRVGYGAIQCRVAPEDRAPECAPVAGARPGCTHPEGRGRR